MAKQGEHKSPWYHLYSGNLPHSWVQLHPVPITEDAVAAYCCSARSSGTTWAARHGRLHLPRPLLASTDRLLLPLIAVFVWTEYTIPAEKSQESSPKTGRRQPSPCFCSFHYRLLERIQMPCFSALAISSSRKIGCAMLISFSARSQVEQPTRLTPPYSVTM